MNEITFPLRLRMKRDTVDDLQAALVEVGHEVSDAERRDHRFGTSTRAAVRKFQTDHALPTTGEVDEATANKINALLREPSATEAKTSRVRGRVVRADGRPVEDAEVKFFSQGITKASPLGRQNSTRTDADGGFAFEYPRPKDPIELGIELVADARRSIADTRPRLIGNAGPDESATFVVGDEAFRGLSTHERLERTIEAMLASEGVKPSEIAGFDQETLARLSLATGIEPRTLVLVRQSYALAKETKLAPEVFFAMGREEVPIGSLSALLVQNPERRRAAVNAALAANHIPARLEKDAAKVLEKLDELTVAEALTNPAAADVTSVGTVLEAARISEPKRGKLAARYISHTGTPEEFWTAVRTSGDLTNAEITRVQLELQLSVATLNHGPLNQALKRNGVATLEDLAKPEFGKQSLLDLVKGTPGNPGAGLPADLKAAGTTEEEYAELIFRVLEDALPTAMVSHRVASFPEPQNIKPFLDNNPDYNLRTTPVRTYLAANPNALTFAANATEAEAVTKAMKRLERVYRIAPAGTRIATMEVLLTNGVHSANMARAMGRAAFVRSFENKLGSREAAERVFRRANNASALSAVLATRYAPAFNSTPFYALPSTLPDPADVRPASKLAIFVELFGSQDFCSCEHCQSVFSPAAYLVDMLNWLNRPFALPGKRALDILFDDRRADIGGIQLSCTNTNTALPYLDIVNETLELLVVPAQGAVNYQTTGTTADLRAHPEHLLLEAYEVLAGAEANTADKDAVYPFNLPFDLWLEEARVYLGQLGMPRYRLMEALQGADTARIDNGVAIEMLGMSPLEWDIIAGQAQPQRSVAELWGLGSDPNFVPTLQNVSRFLEQATPPIAEHGMEFSELTDLLRTDFVQTQAQVKVVFAASTCDTDRATLAGLSPPHLDRMHRFIRLQRRLGWSALDLDRAISVLGAGTLDAACLRKIAHVHRLALKFKLPVPELLTWWGLLDTRRWRIRLLETLTPTGFDLTFDNELKKSSPERNEDASPYDKLFLSPSLDVEPSAFFGVRSKGDELKTPILGGLSAQLTPIASALGGTAEEFAELFPLLATQPPDLNLSNLSDLYRHLSLARALKLSVRDLVSAISLTGIDPFDATKTENTLAFADEVQIIRDSRFSISELDYLLRHVDTKPTTSSRKRGSGGFVVLA